MTWNSRNEIFNEEEVQNAVDKETRRIFNQFLDKLITTSRPGMQAALERVKREGNAPGTHEAIHNYISQDVTLLFRDALEPKDEPLSSERIWKAKAGALYKSKEAFLSFVTFPIEDLLEFAAFVHADNVRGLERGLMRAQKKIEKQKRGRQYLPHRQYPDEMRNRYRELCKTMKQYEAASKVFGEFKGKFPSKASIDGFIRECRKIRN